MAACGLLLQPSDQLRHAPKVLLSWEKRCNLQLEIYEIRGSIPDRAFILRVTDLLSAVHRAVHPEPRWHSNNTITRYGMSVLIVLKTHNFLSYEYFASH